MPETPETASRGSTLPPPDDLNALPRGTRFGELEILRTLGVGGFGIVYLAQDHALEREVAIKEYMPGQLAQRGSGSRVSLRSVSCSETFDIGRRSFVNEARLLARFDHPSLLKVYRFWEDNGTAYMLMPYLQGQTLKQARQAMHGRPDEAWLRDLLLPLLDGLALLHAESVYHRDISPDNILLPDGGGDPILLDFGAARRAIGDNTQTFTTILKPRFAPIEQYGEADGLRQGPWTDLYSLGAVMHFTMLGHTPPSATTRTVADSYHPLSRLGMADYSPAFLATIDWSLGVRPQDRPQSAGEMRAALTGELTPPAPPAPAAMADDERTIAIARDPAHDKTVELQRPSAPRRAAVRAKPAALSGLPLALVGGAALAVAGITWWAMRASHADAPAIPALATAQVAAAQPTPAPSTPAQLWTVPASAPAVAAAMPAAKPVARSLTPADTKPARDARAPWRSEASLPAPALSNETPTARPPSSSAVAAATTAQNVAAAKPADPREACGGRIFIARDICMERKCREPAYTAHAECAKLRDYKTQRERYGTN
ncbi:MAG TPA: serine/threonine-protein kinase [Ideonella sp.]|nr:serine/threonine-protein kinase [Ideonella sp.]